LIISPVIPRQFTEDFIDENGLRFLAGIVKKVELLTDLYAQLANEKKCFYLDSSKIKPSEIDGIHLDKTAHQIYAEIINQKIKDIF